MITHKTDPCAYGVTLALVPTGMHVRTHMYVYCVRPIAHAHPCAYTHYTCTQPRICTRTQICTLTCVYKFMHMGTLPHTRSCMGAHSLAYLQLHACNLTRARTLVHSTLATHTRYAHSRTPSLARTHMHVKSVSWELPMSYISFGLFNYLHILVI